MSKQEWVEMMLPHIVRDLKEQKGFSLSRSHNMVQFSPDYQAVKGLRINSYELGTRAYRALKDENE
jgi:hypothetical protein